MTREYSPDLSYIRHALKEDGKLVIEWNDGHVSTYNPWHLRKNCPCALCSSSKKAGGLPMFAGPVRIEAINPVGRYALQFSFSDGHGTGIYRYEFLRDLCQCEKCVQEAKPV